MCFYFDAKLGDKGTVDDCEYSAVDEVQQWIANHRRAPQGQGRARGLRFVRRAAQEAPRYF